MKTSPMASDASVMYHLKYGSSRLPDLYTETSMFYQIMPTVSLDKYLWI